MTGSTAADLSVERDEFVQRKERLYRWIFAGCAVLTVLVTVGIVITLSLKALVFFGAVSPVDFFTNTTWDPLINGNYGVLPLISGTLIVTVSAAVIALPIGLAIAVYMSEYASPTVRAVLKPALEILAGIPTVIYGYFALVYLTPILQGPLPISITILPTPVSLAFPFFGSVTLSEYVFVIPSLRTFNALSASIVVAIMVIPMVSSISEDALNSVPDSLRQAGYGLGSTKFDVSTKVVIPAATSGIISSYVLAVSRAIGETMAVTMAAGQSPKMPYFPDILANLTNSIETMTAAMVKIAGAESLGETVAYESMFAIGLTLFGMTLLMNLLAELIRRRYREVYD